MDLELEKRRRKKTSEVEYQETLIDFIPRVSPKYSRPHHLGRLVRALQQAETEPVRVIVNIPPRHSKTETILHSIARRIKRRPWETIAYVTATQELAKSKSLLARQYAERAGVVLHGDANAWNEWRTPEMGGALFTSIGGSIIGQGCHLLIIDDPHKDRADAESPVMREKVWSWFTSTGYDRLEPNGSVVICQTRWHPDDITGRALDDMARENWDHIELPALGIEVNGKRIADDDHGEALWPERWPRHELLKKKVDEYEWNSKFQQRPTKRGGAVFKGANLYDPARRPSALRISIGIDLAYSEDTHADHSAIVVLGQCVVTGLIYVLYAQREQLEIPQMKEIIEAQSRLFPGARIHWHTSSTEKGTAQLLKLLGLPVRWLKADVDKFTRAQPAAAAWNLGQILVPGGIDANGNPVERPLWVAPFLKEINGFTGLGDREDDQVDATTSAFYEYFTPPRDRIDDDGSGSQFG